MIYRKPHREICSLCHEVSRVSFEVPDEIWKLSVHVSQQNDILCLRCFTRLADERGVGWDKEIKFYPCSRASQDKVVKKVEEHWREREREEKAEGWMRKKGQTVNCLCTIEEPE